MDLNELYSLVVSSQGISTDTRALRKGQVFFALRGPNNDGNRHALAALEAGAAAAVVDDASLKSEKVIYVNDVLKALTDLAVMHRMSLKVPVIAITGSNGKTTTKELVTAVLSKKGRVHSTSGNLNNHIGVPLTLMSAPADAAFLVIEMGANHQGEIASLCSTARPTHGIITNIGRAHLEGFGTYEDVIKAKSELYQWLGKTGGTAIYNEKDSILHDLVKKMAKKAIPYSSPAGLELLAEPIDNNYLLMEVAASYGGRRYDFSTHLYGSYNIDNVLAAAATGLLFGVQWSDVIDAISSYRPSNNRSQVLSTESNTLICDSYNANPSSMTKVLKSFIKLNAERKMIILGDMLELGSGSIEEHRRIVSMLKDCPGADVCLVGPLFAAAAKDSTALLFESSAELREWLLKTKPTGYTVLVKGSRGMMLEKIYDVL